MRRSTWWGIEEALAFSTIPTKDQVRLEGSLFSFSAHEWSLEVRRTKLDDMFSLSSTCRRRWIFLATE